MNYRRYIAERIKIDGVDVDEIYSSIALPPNTEMGDFALPCFKFAKILRKSPAVIAEELKNVYVTDNVINEVSAVNGYLNFKVNKAGLASSIISEVLNEGGNFGSSDMDAKRSISVSWAEL